MSRAFRWTARAVAVFLVAFLVAAITMAWLWRERAAVSDLALPVSETRVGSGGTVTVTWLGITTLLFDDGETQILTDGTFTRLSPFDIALQRKVRSDIATINYAMDEFQIERLAAVVPVHSHFDHAMDAGNVANRSPAVILGSESAANIARGANVPVDQYQILASGESRHFGEFTITLIESAHVPGGWNGRGWFAGLINEPLTQPARVWSWRGGTPVSILIEHPAGSALVQGSAGVVDGQLIGRDADVVLLSIAGLAALGKDYARHYWDETVAATGATRALAIHYDDFTRPFGDVQLLPDVADRAVESSHWLSEFAQESGVDIERPPFGIPLTLF
jgi:L-ascorbate metabolism protein UlaG (beta-lactamase superfamily)